MAEPTTAGAIVADRTPPLAARMGFWIRLLAFIIDAIVVGIISGIIGAITGTSIDPNTLGTPGAASANPYGTIISIIYTIGFWVYSGATPGKMLLGMRIVTLDADKPTFGQAIVRYIGYIVSAVVILLGFIWIAGEQRRGWHDRIAGTYVVKTKWLEQGRPAVFNG